MSEFNSSLKDLVTVYYFITFILHVFAGGKKARSFDFMTMFEETRKSAIERSKDTLCE